MLFLHIITVIIQRCIFFVFLKKKLHDIVEGWIRNVLPINVCICCWKQTNNATQFFLHKIVSILFRLDYFWRKIINSISPYTFPSYTINNKILRGRLRQPTEFSHYYVVLGFRRILLLMDSKNNETESHNIQF